MRIGKWSCIALIVSILASEARAGVDLGFAREDGGQAGAFLDFAASARSLGMGRAHLAVTDDAGAVYWNPAGLARIDRQDVVSMYSFLHEDTGFGYASFAQPTVGAGTLGVGLVSLRSGGFERRDASGNQNGSYDVSELGLLLGHGIALTDRLSFGSTLKIVRQSVDSFSGTGYGLDLGLMTRVSPRVHAGFALRNLVAPSVKLRNHADDYPRDIRAGLKFAASKKLLLASDLIQTQNRSLKLSLGGEYAVNHILLLRAGLNETEVSAGLGFRLQDFGIDYAFGYHDAVAGLSDLGASHRLGFHFSFGKRYSEQVASLRWQRRGQEVLQVLKIQMDLPAGEQVPDLQRHVTVAGQVIRHNGYVAPQDLYMAQGYISYLQGDFERSVQSLSEALTLVPDDAVIVRHLEAARANMTAEQTRKLIESEFASCKENYEAGNFRTSLVSCEKVLGMKADHVEAAAYAEDARTRINEPIERELKIARAKFDQGDYLGVLKHLQVLKAMDPQNADATVLMDEALAELEREASAQPESPGGDAAVYQIDSKRSREFYGQGLMFYSQGKLDDAATAWGQAVKYDNANTLARNAYNRVITELKEQRP